MIDVIYAWRPRLSRLVVRIATISASACSFSDPELDDESGGGLPSSVASAKPLVSEVENAAVKKRSHGVGTKQSSTQPNKLSQAPSVPCPEHMLEVEGLYCTDLMHRCVKGGKNHLHEDAGEPEPFYCDKYQAGFAKCLGKEEPKHFCIDEYEYPNQLGTIPMVMVSWYEAAQLCEIQNKRLCDDDEWTLACEGPDRRPYPYGFERDATACNIDHLWVKPDDGLLASKTASAAEIQAEVDRLSKRVPSGSMPRCRSPYGVMDMGGNVDEWAVNVTLHGKPYQSVFKGGHWVSGARNRCRPITASHDESTFYYAEGFRCCADVLND
jgi:hypothetical protein